MFCILWFLICRLISLQLDDDWWKTDYQAPNTPEEEVVEVDDEEETNEVELDSLGWLFNELANAGSSQDLPGVGEPVVKEVTPSASDTETLGRRQTQLTVRKVPFSHTSAYLDPHLFLKKIQHAESKKRKTQSSSSNDLNEGLPLGASPRRARRPERLSPSASCPQAGQMKAPLSPSDMAYLASSPSSGASSANADFTINVG